MVVQVPFVTVQCVGDTLAGSGLQEAFKYTRPEVDAALLIAQMMEVDQIRLRPHNEEARVGCWGASCGQLRRVWLAKSGLRPSKAWVIRRQEVDCRRPSSTWSKK